MLYVVITANEDDEELKELLMYSTLETLGDDYKRLEISRQFMKNETNRITSYNVCYTKLLRAGTG